MFEQLRKVPRVLNENGSVSPNHSVVLNQTKVAVLARLEHPATVL